MNMQKLMQEAQKMQNQLKKEQEELENTIYEGSSSLVSLKMNGKYEVLELSLKLDDFDSSDKDLLEDMILVAFNDATKKIVDDKNKKMSKFGQGIPGLF